MDRATNIRIARYQVQLFADPAAACRATITAYGEATEGQVLVVVAHFVTPDRRASPRWVDDHVAHVFYGDEEYDRVLDLLRNESPVRFFAHGDPREWRFGTGSEDVGEGDR